MTMKSIFAALLFAFALPIAAQQARITEEIRSLKTYPFGDPNDIPILVKDTRLYPYHTFEGYSHESEMQNWKVVKLENEFIEVYVFPEAGGKVWGAIEKATGQEFIYRNEVMKFRNIALRGPWTSGGIEFNFGVIGHTPSTASAVNYKLIENEDGSVSCWVGSTDLPSHATWRVEIRLPAETSYFETNVTFSNPTSLEQPYYNWMTAAAFAQDDLVVSIPGTQYLKHSGESKSWPYDDTGRFLPAYANNNYEGHKSFHVVGEYDDFFGGYYKVDDYGFGHWAPFEDQPGQKLWLWASSREGEVWDDLLTDTDGQYVEYQAGRMLVQYSPGAHQNPITKAAFPPLATDRWSERWFPVMGTGGLSDASDEGALHVSRTKTGMQIGLNSFVSKNVTVQIFSNESDMQEESVSMTPLVLWESNILDANRIVIPELDLEWRADRSHLALDRPFELNPEARPSLRQIERDVFEGRELMKARYYRDARGLFESALEAEKWNRDALVELAKLDLRQGLFASGIERINRARQLDAHDAEANFVAGSLYQATDADLDARDAFSWAARSMEFRSAAYTRLAELAMKADRFDEAELFAERALSYDTQSSHATSLLAIMHRGSEGSGLVDRMRLNSQDPLGHYLHAERFFVDHDWSAFKAILRNEFPDQIVLDLAIRYARIGRSSEAVSLLENHLADATDPMVALWLGYLTEDAKYVEQATTINNGIGKPYRVESLPVLEWARSHSSHWLMPYMQGLNLWALARQDETLPLWVDLANTPDHAAFYVARANLASQLNQTDPKPDLLQAVAQDDANRLTHVELVRHFQSAGMWQQAMDWIKKITQHWPDDFNLQLLQAKAHLFLLQPNEAISIMETTRVLPSENGRESHHLFESAHLMRAIQLFAKNDFKSARQHVSRSREWPERLGQGKPYDVDVRMADYLDYRIALAEGHNSDAEEAAELILISTGTDFTSPNPLNLLAADVMRRNGFRKEADDLRTRAKYGLENANVGLTKMLVDQATRMEASN